MSSSSGLGAEVPALRSGGRGGGQGIEALEWRFSQAFGERAVGEEVQDIDIISAIEFDKTGEHLATGDRGGRVVLFKRTDGKDLRVRQELEKVDVPFSRHPEYQYSTEFQSHEPEFDYLNSLEIEEKINKIRWCHIANSALFLLSTNDKTIKLWKVSEKKVKKVTDLNLEPAVRFGNKSLLEGSLLSSPKACSLRNSFSEPQTLAFNDDSFLFPSHGKSSLRLPRVSCVKVTPFARSRKVYANAHAYHINSISNNSDGETFISADDLRINLWNMEITNQSFNIVDVKPSNMEDLTEVITSAEFHPLHCNLFAYSSSKGTIRLVDMRQSALCDKHVKSFEEQEERGSRSFCTEIIASISDIKFARGGRYVLSRDYMTLKLWDVNMEASPVLTFKVHEYLRPKLCDLYENDSIFDKFECCISGDGLRVATGSYNNLFRIFGVSPGNEESMLLEASRMPNRRRLLQTPNKSGRFANFARGRRDNGKGNESPGIELNGANHDFTSKLLHLAWNPAANLIACAAANSLYMYCA